MPYITEKDRTCYLPNNNLSLEYLGKQVGLCARNGGDLQFVIAYAINIYLHKTGISYKHLEDVMGVFTGGLREFQRKVVDPYESKKEKENGEIYTISKYI